MCTVNVREAKAHLSRLLAEVAAGDDAGVRRQRTRTG
jgi:antitoxin (DNA-binding transcriptional repressor) of toxin-antitoxin stability system